LIKFDNILKYITYGINLEPFYEFLHRVTDDAYLMVVVNNITFITNNHIDSLSKHVLNSLSYQCSVIDRFVSTTGFVEKPEK